MVLFQVKIENYQYFSDVHSPFPPTSYEITRKMNPSVKACEDKKVFIKSVN